MALFWLVRFYRLASFKFSATFHVKITALTLLLLLNLLKKE